MTSIGNDLAEPVRMLECLPAEGRDRVLRALDGAPRGECSAVAQRFRPLPASKGPLQVMVRTLSEAAAISRSNVACGSVNEYFTTTGYTRLAAGRTVNIERARLGRALQRPV